MADTKLSALSALAGSGTAAGDLLYIDDVSAGTAGSKSIRLDEILAAGSAVTAASPTWTGVQTFNGQHVLSGTLSPTALAADQNDYNPTNLATAIALRIDGGAADRNITGLAGGVDGRIITVTNVGATNSLVFSNQNASSTAANRFLLPADATLAIDTAIALRYDGVSSRWRPWSRALSNTGVTVGSYTVASITVDAQGRLTAASSGTAVPAAANPTGTVGLVAANGVATTFTRSDATHALDVTIAPTMTGVWTFTPAARSSGVAPFFSINVPADTGQTAATEAPGVLITGAIRTHAAGTIPMQRDTRITATTHAFASASTITAGATLAISGPPIAGTNATIPISWAFLVESGQSMFMGRVNVNNQVGNSPTFYIDPTAGPGLALKGISAMTIGWASGTTPGTDDTGLARVAAKVLKITDGSTNNGWVSEEGVYRLTADVTNATATMANLTALTVTLIAGRKYVGELVVFASNSTAAEGIQFDFDGGAATATSFVAGLMPASGTTLGVVFSNAIATDLTATLATTGDICYVIKFEIVVNAGGTFIPRFSEVSHATGTATAHLGSYMTLKDCPT